MLTKRHRRDSLPVNAEINLTNLIDIAFVLLIIFMITAPAMMEGAVKLELPKADVAPMESSEQVNISLTLDGKIFIDKTEVTFEDLGAQMQRYVGGNKTIAIRADGGRPSRDLTRAIAIVNKAGITNVGIVADPEDER